MTGIGPLDQLLIFEVALPLADGDAGETGQPVWDYVGQAWAAVKPVAAREGQRRGGASRAGNIYLITLHRRTDLTQAMRINWGGVVMSIREIRPPSVGAMFMTILAEAGITQ